MGFVWKKFIDKNTSVTLARPWPQQQLDGEDADQPRWASVEVDPENGGLLGGFPHAPHSHPGLHRKGLACHAIHVLQIPRT